jgi:hypothetical protein
VRFTQHRHRRENKWLRLSRNHAPGIRQMILSRSHRSTA